MSNVPVGYKQTDVGVIPEDWKVEPLENYTSFISYGFTNPMPTSMDGVYMITARDINSGRILLENARCTTYEAFNKLLTPKSRPKKQDLLLTKDGTLGRLAIVDDDLICINQSVAIIRPNNKINPLFFKLLLESPPYQSKMLDDAGGSTIKHIYITIVSRMLLGVPPTLTEQTAIATALSDVDALLNQLDKLIAKKRDIKQATMQQLLTGKKRLAGFSGEWEVKKLGEVADITRGASPRPIDSPIWFNQQSIIGWVRISDVTKSNKYLKETSQKLSELGIQHSRYVPKDSLIMSICATVGRPILTEIDVCIHDGFVVFKNLNIDKNYLYYFLSFIEANWAKSGQTGSQMNLNTELINGTYISFPIYTSEQTAIATLLTDIDNEIAQLQQRRHKTHALKQGMMQQLLTGKIRLVS